MPARPRKSPAEGMLDVAGKPARWRRDGVLDGRPLVVLAHGAGAPETSPFMEAVAAGLVERRLAVVRFRFPYLERAAREHRRLPPDRAPVLIATWATMLREVATWERSQRLPIVLAGKSMGARMASLLLAEQSPPAVCGAVYFGYPLSPAGRPGEIRGEHLPRVPAPQLFISGSRDPLCDLRALAAILGPLGARATLHVVERGDHSLATSRRAPLAGSAAWLDVAAAFVNRCAVGLSPGS